MEELEKNINKRKIYISLLVSVICIISVSYAFFVLYLRQTDNNAVTALSCFTSTLTEENSAINLTDEFPIKDEDGIKKTPFTFKITNNCNNYVKAYITIDPLKEGTANYILSKYMKANVSTKGSTDGTSLIIGTQNTKVLDNKHNGYIVKEVWLNSKESKEFDLRLWIDYDTTKEQAAGMTYLSQVVIVTEPGKGPTFAETILANNEVKAPLTTPGKEVSAYTKDDLLVTKNENIDSYYQSYYFTYGTDYEANGTKFNLTGATVTSSTFSSSYSELVGKYLLATSYFNVRDFSKSTKTLSKTTNQDKLYYVVSATSSSITYKDINSNKKVTESLIATTEDDYGTSYYFRGKVKNNYVQFANKCWRIVRITGDGSVKLVLYNDNISNVNKPCSSSNSSTTAAFAKFSGNTSTTEFNTTNKTDNTSIGFMHGIENATDYASAHANTNKSTILTNLETWYKNNLESFETKLADVIWCNDKSGGSYGEEPTDYGAAIRRETPSLICPNDNNGGKLSKFTVDDTTNGNGNLTYKIGLLTSDEVVYSGHFNSYSDTSATYLQENAIGSWWTLSPGSYNDDGGGLTSTIYTVEASGSVNDTSPGYTSNLRPAIALIPTTKVTGSGTSEDPYIIE